MKEAKSATATPNVTETSVGDSSGSGFVAPEAKELDALIPGFDVTELIGRGGMGAVYLGRQSSLDRKVAIKILPREAQSNSQLGCLLYTSPSPRDATLSRMPSSA